MPDPIAPRTGCASLKDLTEVTESEVTKLHGMGPNAMRALRAALQERGLSFRPS